MPGAPRFADLPHVERRELLGLVARDGRHVSEEEAEWAIRQAYVVDPGTDSPAVKLLQRRRNEHRERKRAAADERAESPLSKFRRVWA